MTTILQPPVLEHDTMMAERFGCKVGPRGKGERRVLWNFLEHMRTSGYRPYCVAGGDDGDEPAVTAQGVMELVFNLDEACVGFVSDADGRVCKREVGNVVLVRGNSPEELISDWRWNKGAAGEAFSAAVERFNTEDFA